MKKEIMSILGKTTRIACVTCFTAGAIAVMTSGAALKSMVEGGKYMANAIKKIVTDNDAEVVSEPCEEVSAEDIQTAKQEEPVSSDSESL